MHISLFRLNLRLWWKNRIKRALLYQLSYGLSAGTIGRANHTPASRQAAQSKLTQRRFPLQPGGLARIGDGEFWTLEGGVGSRFAHR
jgi:hypothetical protein